MSLFPSEVGKRKFCSRRCLAASKTSEALAVRASVSQTVGGAHVLPLANGLTTLVSQEDAAALASTPWFQTKRGYVVTAGSGKPRRQVRMHRLVMERKIGRKLSPKELVDHKDRNPGNNRRGNLRLASPSQNNANRAGRSRSGHKGVTHEPYSNRWVAQISTGAGGTVVLGRYTDKAEAAWTYDQFASQIYGEFAVLNFTYC